MADASDWSAAQASALAWLEANLAALSADHMTLWDFHEPSWREYKSSAWYMDRLEREGFAVERGTAGMPTAFRARWSNGAGPVLAGYAEYDAVPGQSQEPVPYRKPREGMSPRAAGHTDPHSALGMGSFGGFLAAKHAMEKHGIGGTLVYFGEPAEKMCGSKPVHAAHGFYDGLDAAISFHPHSFAALTNGCFWDTQQRPLLEPHLHLRMREPGDVAERGGRRLGHACPCHRARARRHRCRLPDVHELQDDEGVDAAAYRQLDAERIHPDRRPGDRRQHHAGDRPDPVRDARADPRHVRGGLHGARPQCRPHRGDDPLHGREGVGHPHPRRPAEPRYCRDHLPQFRAPRRAAMVARRRSASPARCRPRSASSRWPSRSPTS